MASAHMMDMSHIPASDRRANVNRLGELAGEQLARTLESRRQFAMRIGVADGTMADFIHGRRVPNSTTLQLIAEGFGWGWKQVTTAMGQNSDPVLLELEDLQAEKPEPNQVTADSGLSEFTDSALLVEITRRLTDRNVTIAQLQGQIHTRRNVAQPALAERITELIGPGRSMAVIAPDEATRNWVATFISAMVPSNGLGSTVGLPQVLVEATAEARRLNIQSSGDLRQITVYTPEDYDWCRSSLDADPAAVTAAELLDGVAGVPDWAHAALAAGATA